MRNNNASSAEPEPKALLPSARTNHSGKNKYLVPAPSEELLTVNLKIGSEEIIWKITATNIVIATPYVKLGDFVVMPDHIHGILILDKPTGKNGNDHNDDHVAQTRLIASLFPSSSKNTGGFAGEKNPMINENISRIIRWYKGRCTYEIRKIHTDFAWQSRFHDHIIRNETEYNRISDYIINNPSNWKNDKF